MISAKSTGAGNFCAVSVGDGRLGSDQIAP